MDQFKDKIFQRTELGDKEIRERTLPLSKVEQTALVAIDGEANYQHLGKRFEVDEQAAFAQAMESLLAKRLIAIRDEVAVTQVDVQDDFFSSSLSGENAVSGVVVDTKSKTARIKQKIHALPKVELDLLLPLELPPPGRDNKGKSRVNKLVQVFPQPPAPKKKRRKKAQAASENKWLMRVYIGMAGLGLLLVLVAVVKVV
ncbi:MAG: hypothetical protein HYR92_06970 [Burkholderiales bacterium]|nr:hypothetical protein [Burkholderiales bacterium]